MIKIIPIILAGIGTLISISFSGKIQGREIRRNYGIVTILKGYPEPNRTTIVLADLAKLDTLDIDTYEYVISSADFGNAIDLDIANDLRDKKNFIKHYGKWRERLAFNIASSGSDMQIFNSKRALSGYLFAYLQE